MDLNKQITQPPETAMNRHDLHAARIELQRELDTLHATPTAARIAAEQGQRLVILESLGRAIGRPLPGDRLATYGASTRRAGQPMPDSELFDAAQELEAVR